MLASKILFTKGKTSLVQGDVRVGEDSLPVIVENAVGSRKGIMADEEARTGSVPCVGGIGPFSHMAPSETSEGSLKKSRM
jgi:hypothetical protein